MSNVSGQLIYSPEIKVYIATNKKEGIIDVSEDVVSFELDRVSNAVSTFMCTLNNKNRKYSMGKDNQRPPLIETLDRIVVFMKRTQMIQVFSGYVTRAPIITVLPNAVQIVAKCTLKKLQNTFWDPGMPEVRALLPGMYSTINTNSTVYDDGGAAKGAYNLLTKVVGWDPAKIHIQQLPPSFIQNVSTSFTEVGSTLETGLALKLKKAVDVQGFTAGGTTLIDSNIQSQYGWATKVLENAGLPTTQITVGNVVRWMYSECPNPDWWSNGFNPLNVNSKGAGYDTFPSLTASAKATADVIKQDNMKEIYRSLKNQESIEKFSKAVIYSPWAAGHYGVIPAIQQYNGNVSEYGVPGRGDDYLSQIPLPDVSIPPGAENSSTAPTSNAIQNAVVELARSKIGTSYSWGGGNSNGPTLGTGTGANTIGFDCSGLALFVYAAVNVTLPHFSGAQLAQGPAVLGLPLPGDLIFYGPNGNDHVSICATSPIDQNGTNGTMIEAPHTGAYVSENPIRPGWTGVTRPWAATSAALGVDSSGVSGQNKSNTSTGSNTFNPDLFNIIFTLPQINPVAIMTFGSPRGFIMDEPVLNAISQITTSVFRDFQSLPNGDFVSWFPDYFGIYTTPTAMKIYNIEITDLAIYHDDDPLTTHVAVSGDPYGIGQSVSTPDWLDTMGIISVQNKSVMNVLMGDGNVPNDFDPDKFMAKYGMRPYVSAQPLIRDHTLEFAYALMTFMRMWSNQYSTQIGFTFMPELYPGMRIQFPDINIQGGFLELYVQAVSHSGSMTNGFSTRATVTAPSVNGRMLYQGITI